MSYRLIQARTDTRTASAGDFYIEIQNEDGSWQPLVGRWAPYEHELAKARLKELEDAELPQIFD